MSNSLTPNITKDELLALEEQYWRAMKDSDVETAISLTRFPCLITSPKGTQKIGMDQYRKMMESHDGSQYENVKIHDAQAEVLTQDAAILSYSVKVNGMEMLDTSTWVRENGRWVCAFHSEHPKAS